ncbi:MAG: HD domain-containing protein, partial [Eubacterium sp.]|nr:HD domain-containing protein [Eubacterium sp.]
MEEKKLIDYGMTRDNYPDLWETYTRRERDIYSRSDDVRSPFTRDYNRVLHSLAYRRLKHKTQVFYNAAGNDHICTRIEHVLHVESVSNNIAHTLGLNEELTRAIAMAHDLGHAPFGHQGERIIRQLTREYLGENFWHEQNGVYLVDKVELLADSENKKRNLNLTYAVRDGIISHCGEVDENGLMPRKELFDLREFDQPGKYNASTWEGCVVKMADKIAYLGRDIEDANRLGYFDQNQKKILQDMAGVLNEKAMNTTVIMHNMIIDLCHNSNPDRGICLSNTMSDQLDELKEFNYKNIYANKRLEPFGRYATLVIQEIFDHLRDLYQGEETLTYIEKTNQKAFVKE